MIANQIVRRLLGISLGTPFASTKCLSTSARLMEKARVQHPAPEFKGQAVIDGQFKEIALEDYKGNGSFSSSILWILHLSVQPKL